ncbi:MAG: LysM peptidoglycan-binding domain-containing protein [Firmicutes bacterium]|nr:LysM peptidoglycan-binding domain-containing protein [Bacillota bacterium]
MLKISRKLSLLLVLTLVLSLIIPFSFVSAEENDSVQITIVHTNDTHARVKEGKYDGMGFAKLATKINDLRKTNPNMLVLDAGDAFHGQTIASLVEGESIVEIMNTIGYDAMAAGNHDFNYGQDRLVELSNMANFPILAANVLKDDESILDKYTIKEIGGVKVGIFGLSTPETTYKTHPKNVEGLNFKDPAIVAQEMVDDLKDKTDVLVCLSHLGLDEASTYTSEYVVNKVDGIDIVVDGHSHSTLENGKKINDTLIVQAGEYDKNLGIVNFSYEDGEIKDLNASLFTKDEASEIKEDLDVVAVVEEIEKENDKVLSAVVGNTDFNLLGERQDVRTGETNLGNLITESMLKATKADVVLTNGGGIRASISPGEITKGDVITVLPFGNFIEVIKVKGSDIVKALEHGISDYPETKGAFPHIAGMTFEFDENKEAGNRVMEVKVNGKAINLDKTYKLATNDFLAAGGDNYSMFKGKETVTQLAGLDEIVMEHIKKYGVADAKVDGRIGLYTPKEKPALETYVVKPGDVLWKIGNKFKVSWEKLAKFNNLKNPNLILPGQELSIPQQ